MRAAVVGVGTTDFGKLAEHDATTLGIWALRNALEDAGLGLSDIDGLIVQRIPDYQKFVRITGMKPRFMQSAPPQGRMTGGSIQLAAQAVLSGAAEVVALVYGNDGSTAGARYGGRDDRYGNNTEQLWFPYGMTSPGALNALMFQRHMALYGTTTDQLGAISVAFRKHAGLNPAAVMKKPITLADYQASPYICAPLRRFDYCLINDGGVAMIVTTPERARDLKHPPVYMRGYSLEARFAQGEFTDDFGRTCMQSVGERTFRMADVGRDDIDALMIYDNFTPSVIFGLEGYGFCGPGEGGPFVADGRLELGGALPSNTNGGQLSESYMQGWALNVEAVRQLRHDCGERQIRDVELVQYISSGPISTSIIYGREA